MQKQTPFSISIFVADGDPDGLRIVERSNWIGKCLIFPRQLLQTLKGRDEFKQTGVYLLTDDRESGKEIRLYIGEGDPVGPRLGQHHANKDFWTRATFFIAGAGQLNKAHVQYLEAEIVQRARAAKTSKLENGNIPTRPSLSVADRAHMDVFLDNLLGILPVLGINAFEKASQANTPETSTLLHCRGRGVEATGRETAQGFLVNKSSQAAKENTPSLQQHFAWIAEKKASLFSKGVLSDSGQAFVLTEDYTFSSPSTAAAVVLGRASNGRTDWKDDSGRTLKEIQTGQAAVAPTGAALGILVEES